MTITEFKNLLDDLIERLPRDKRMRLEFSLFDNADFGGRSYEFMSMIVTYFVGENIITKKCYDICKETDKISYDTYIRIANDKAIHSSKVCVVDGR